MYSKKYIISESRDLTTDEFPFVTDDGREVYVYIDMSYHIGGYGFPATYDDPREEEYDIDSLSIHKVYVQPDELTDYREYSPSLNEISRLETICMDYAQKDSENW